MRTDISEISEDSLYINPDINAATPGVLREPPRTSWGYWKWFARTSPIKDWDEAFQRVHPQFRFLLAELTGMLVTDPAPLEAPKGLIADVAAWVHEQLLATVEWQQLRHACGGEWQAARIAACAVCAFIEALKLPEEPEPQPPGASGSDGDDTGDTGDAGGEGGTSPGDSGQGTSSPPDAPSPGQGLREWLASRQDNSTKQAARAAAGAQLAGGLQNVQGFQQAVGAAWGDSPGEAGNARDDVAALAEAVMQVPGLTDLLEAIGRFDALFDSDASQSSSEMSIFRDDIKHGGSVAHATTTTRLMMAHPGFRALGAHMLSTSQLPSYDYAPDDADALGPIYIALDRSGSMTPHMTNAKAFAAAIWLRASGQGRPVRMWVFDTRAVEIPLLTVAEGLRALGKVTPHGGTRISVAVDAVMAAIEADEPGADMLLVSDDFDNSVSAERAEELRAGISRLHYLVIGRGSCNPTLARAAFATYIVDNTNHGEVSLREIARSLK